MSYGVALRNSVALGIGGIVPLSGNLEAQPNFNWINNTSLRTALIEAAYTGLVLGMGDPGFEENWLRGVRQGPLATGVTGATYARSGTRAGLDPANLFAPNVVRREAGLGVRVFGSGVNLIYASEAFDNAVWTKVDATVTANAGVAPNGTMTADKLVESTSSSTHLIRSTSFGSGTITNGVNYAYSVYLKAAERSWAVLELEGLFGGGFAWFNLSNGTIGTQTALVSASISSVGNGWYRCTIIDLSTGTGGATTRCNLFTAPLNDIVNYLGDGTSGILVWGAQLEQSSFVTDYIPNASTTVSASAGADNLQIAASSLPSSGPIVFIADLPAQAIVGTIPRVFEWNGLITLQNNSTSSIYSTSDGSANGPTQSGLTVNGARRVAMLYTPGAATRLSVNGSAVVVGTDVGVAVPTAVNYIGNRAALDRPLNGSLGVFAAYPGNPSDAQLQAMSAL